MGRWRYWNLKLEILAAPLTNSSIYKEPSPPSCWFWSIQIFGAPSPSPTIFGGCLKISAAPPPPPPQYLHPPPCHVKWTFPNVFARKQTETKQHSLQLFKSDGPISLSTGLYYKSVPTNLMPSKILHLLSENNRPLNSRQNLPLKVLLEMKIFLFVLL